MKRTPVAPGHHAAHGVAHTAGYRLCWRQAGAHDMTELFEFERSVMPNSRRTVASLDSGS